MHAQTETTLNKSFKYIRARTTTLSKSLHLMHNAVSSAWFPDWGFIRLSIECCALFCHANTKRTQAHTYALKNTRTHRHALTMTAWLKAPSALSRKLPPRKIRLSAAPPKTLQDSAGQLAGSVKKQMCWGVKQARLSQLPSQDLIVCKPLQCQIMTINAVFF